VTWPGLKRACENWIEERSPINSLTLGRHCRRFCVKWDHRISQMTSTRDAICHEEGLASSAMRGADLDDRRAVVQQLVHAHGGAVGRDEDYSSIRHHRKQPGGRGYKSGPSFFIRSMKARNQDGAPQRSSAIN
jgi:hypothetical protein